MGLIGSVIGAGAQLYGGYKAGQLQKKNMDMYQDRISRYQNRMDAVVNEDPTQNVNTMAAVEAAQQLQRQNNAQAKAAQVLGGGTDEAAAQQKVQGQQTAGQMLNNAAIQGQQRQDQAWQQGNQMIDQMSQYIAAARNAQAQAITQAASGVGQAAGSMSFGTGNILGKKVRL